MLVSVDGVALTRAPATGVLTLDMGGGPNLINPTMVSALMAAVDAAEKAEHPKALIVSASGKWLCNGLDIAWMATNPKETPAFLESFWRFLARLLVLDCHTVAAINGHAFGAGLFISLACDWRIMRTGHGFANFPELNIGLRLSNPFAELIKAKLSPSTFRAGVLMCQKFNSAEALAAGVIDQECSIEELPALAERMAIERLPANLKLRNFNPEAFITMKKELYPEAYRALNLGVYGATPESRL